MSRIRSQNTRIELAVFKFLRHNGVYFQKHYKKIAGKPDIALPGKKLAVFIDGDFWHGRDFLRRKKRLPPYWRSKIDANIKRDNRHRYLLKKSGWKIMRVWECDLERCPQKTLERILLFLNED